MTPSQPQMNTCPDHDTELLSCYLDDQLSEQERTHLETRLATEPALQTCLDELSATVVVLHDLEPVPLPRSFTLDLAAARQRPRWQGWLQMSGALATILLALIVTAVYGVAADYGMADMTSEESQPVAVHINMTTLPGQQEAESAAPRLSVQPAAEREQAAEEAAPAADEAAPAAPPPAEQEANTAASVFEEAEEAGESPHPMHSGEVRTATGTDGGQESPGVSPPPGMRPFSATPPHPRTMTTLPTRAVHTAPTASLFALTAAPLFPGATEETTAASPSPVAATSQVAPSGSDNQPPASAPPPAASPSLLLLILGGVVLVGGGVGLVIWFVQRQAS